MTWTAAGQQERREQLGRFLLGTGGTGRIAGATGPGLPDSEGPALIDRAAGEGSTALDTADMYIAGTASAPPAPGTGHVPLRGASSRQKPASPRTGRTSHLTA